MPEPQSQSKVELIESLRLANINAGLSFSFAALMSGVFLVGFMKEELGASDFWVNLLAALPHLLGILQIPGAILSRTTSGYRRFVFLAGLGWRICHIPLVFLPLLPWPETIRLYVLAICVGVGSASVLLVNPSTPTGWQT